MLATQLPLLAGILFSIASSVFSGVAAVDPAISGASIPPTVDKRCINPIIRKEWRTLSRKEKKSYISAVQCILKKPAITPKDVAPGAISRYDDLIVTHVLQFFDIHFTGRFLPWHRYYVATYERILRQECGYNGAQPYWDWTLDALPIGNFTASPLWDPVDGFGGNGPYVELPADYPAPPIVGRTGGGCVQNGPFVNMTVRIGPGADLSGNPRCLTRDFSPQYANENSARSVLDRVLAEKRFAEMVRTMEGWEAPFSPAIHGGGHYSVGGSLGSMGDPHTSVADPVFYLHHANIDRVWWSWQKKNLRKRLTDFDGPLVLWDYDNKIDKNATLDTLVDIGYSAPAVRIGDVMDVRSLCYDYDRVY